MIPSLAYAALAALLSQSSSTTTFAVNEVNSTGNVHLAILVGGQPISSVDLPVTFGGFLDVAVEHDSSNVPTRALMWSSSALSVTGIESFVVDVGLLGSVPVQFANSVLHFGRQSGGSVVSNPIMPLAPGPQASPLPIYESNMSGHGLQFRGVVTLGPATGTVQALIGGPGATAVYDFSTVPFPITIPSGTTFGIIDDGTGPTDAMISLDAQIQDVLGTEASYGVRADLTITGAIFADFASSSPVPIVEPPVGGGTGTGGFVIPFIPAGVDPLANRADILSPKIPEAGTFMLVATAIPMMVMGAWLKRRRMK